MAPAARQTFKTHAPHTIPPGRATHTPLTQELNAGKPPTLFVACHHGLEHPGTGMHAPCNLMGRGTRLVRAPCGAGGTAMASGRPEIFPSVAAGHLAMGLHGGLAPCGQGDTEGNAPAAYPVSVYYVSFVRGALVWTLAAPWGCAREEDLPTPPESSAACAPAPTSSEHGNTVDSAFRLVFWST